MIVLTDQALYQKAKFFGKNALKWRQKFMGLLPEINRRRIFEKKGFGSIFEFAFKLAGLSEEQVRRVLNLEKKFISMPVLQNLLVQGEVSVNKLARVASIASPQNEHELAQALQLLPKSAVETLVRDGLYKPKTDTKSVPGHDHARECTLKLSDEVTAKLLKLQEKGIDVNGLILDMLKKREDEIEEEKVTISQSQKLAKSRYVPARIKRVLSKEHGTKCSIQTCSKPAEQLHHTQTFALSRRHDPNYLAPLCKDHHTIAHSINLRVLEKREEAIK